MTLAAAIPNVDDLLTQLEAELTLARADLRDVTRRSRAFLANSKKRRDESLIAKLRRQFGLG